MTDPVALRHHIEIQMDEYNASPGVVRLNLILFRDAIEHICRIIRVVSQVKRGKKNNKSNYIILNNNLHRSKHNKKHNFIYSLVDIFL